MCKSDVGRISLSQQDHCDGDFFVNERSACLVAQGVWSRIPDSDRKLISRAHSPEWTVVAG